LLTLGDDHLLRVCENRKIMRIFILKTKRRVKGLEKIAEGRILRFNISAKYYLGDQIKDDKVGGLCGTSEAE
jgi:hypothetical protein